MAACPTTVAYSAPSGLHAWTADDQAIYFAENDSSGTTIQRLDLGTRAVSIAAHVSNSENAVTAIVSAPPNLYYVGESALVEITPAGTKELALVDARTSMLRTDGDYLYWLVLSSTTVDASGTHVPLPDGKIQRMRIDGGPIETIVTSATFGSDSFGHLHDDFALAGEILYYLDAEGLSRIDKSGGAPEPIVVAADLSNIVDISGTDAILTAIVPLIDTADPLPGRIDRTEVRRVNLSNRTSEVFASVTFAAGSGEFHKALVGETSALKDAGRIYLWIRGNRYPPINQFGGLFLIQNGITTELVDGPFAPVPLAVHDESLFGVAPDFPVSACCVVETLCAAPARIRAVRAR